MTNHQLEFLAGRLRAACEVQPRIVDLRAVLLGFDGSELVAPSDGDPDLEELLDHSQIMTNEVRATFMAGNAVIKMPQPFGRNKSWTILERTTPSQENFGATFVEAT